MNIPAHARIRLGAELLRQRIANGHSLRSLARLLDMQGHGGLADYEHGRRIPPEDLIERYERALRIPDDGLRRLRRAALLEKADQEIRRRVDGGEQARIAIVDDDPIVRATLARYLKAHQLVCSVATPEELPQAQIDVVLLDLYDATRARLDAVPMVASRHRVLAMSAYGEDSDVLTAMRSGAAGYVVKSQGGQAFSVAVAAVASGDSYLSPSLYGIVLRELAEALPFREVEVIAWMARGTAVEVAAKHLGVTAETVQSLLRRTRARLGLVTRNELVQWSEEESGE